MIQSSLHSLPCFFSSLLLFQREISEDLPSVDLAVAEDGQPAESHRIYGKTCLKLPLKKKTKNWFARLIIA